jgi:hypothetical protein
LTPAEINSVYTLPSPPATINTISSPSYNQSPLHFAPESVIALQSHINNLIDDSLLMNPQARRIALATHTRSILSAFASLIEDNITLSDRVTFYEEVGETDRENADRADKLERELNGLKRENARLRLVNKAKAGGQNMVGGKADMSRLDRLEFELGKIRKEMAISNKESTATHNTSQCKVTTTLATQMSASPNKAIPLGPRIPSTTSRPLPAKISLPRTPDGAPCNSTSVSRSIANLRIQLAQYQVRAGALLKSTIALRQNAEKMQASKDREINKLKVENLALQKENKELNALSSSLNGTK